MDKTKKEMLIAGLIGLFLGLGLGYLASNIKNINVTTSFNKPISETPFPTEAPTSSPNVSSTVTLSIISPDDESINKTGSITVEGRTDPEATIIVSSEEDDIVVTPNKDGSFSTKISLTPEENQIVISSSLGENHEIIKRLVIYEKPEE